MQQSRFAAEVLPASLQQLRYMTELKSEPVVTASSGANRGSPLQIPDQRRGDRDAPAVGAAVAAARAQKRPRRGSKP
jgi:hypothetical protein